VAYFGEEADDHTMDVEELGPALLAFSKLVKSANTELNKNRSAVKVVVVARNQAAGHRRRDASLSNPRSVGLHCYGTTSVAPT